MFYYLWRDISRNEYFTFYSHWPQSHEVSGLLPKPQQLNGKTSQFYSAENLFWAKCPCFTAKKKNKKKKLHEQDLC